MKNPGKGGDCFGDGTRIGFGATAPVHGCGRNGGTVDKSLASAAASPSVFPGAGHRGDDLGMAGLLFRDLPWGYPSRMGDGDVSGLAGLGKDRRTHFSDALGTVLGACFRGFTVSFYPCG